MSRIFLATVTMLALLVAPARAESDPVTLLTGNDPVARIIRQAEPTALLDTAPTADAVAKDKAVVVKPAAKVKGPGKVELAAIYYYAEQKQDARVKAEFERLKFKYPDFRMPEDLGKPQVAELDERSLWALYNKDDMTGVEQEIARLKTADPAWMPSEDFAGKFARKKLRNVIASAHKAKNWPLVLSAGAALDPATEKEADLLWDLIDAYAATGNKDALGRYYRAILFRDPANQLPKAVIVATIQKATRDFSPDDIRAVMARFSTDPEIVAGLAAVSVDLIRKEVADFNVNTDLKDPLAKGEIDALRSAAASTDSKTADFSLLGWYYLKIKQPAEAGAWFQRALEKEPDIEHAKGLYLALVQQDRQVEAYDLALKYQVALAADPIFLMNALAERFAKPETGKIDPAAVKAYSGTILATKNPDHAEILAWYAYNSGQYEASRAWFGKAFGWKPVASRLKGLALSEGQLNDRSALVALYQRYGTQYPDIWDDVHLNRNGQRRIIRTAQNPIDRMEVGAVERGKQIRPAFVTDDEPAARPLRRKTTSSNVATSRTSTTAARLLQSKRYSQCVASLQGQLSADASLTRGWCLLGLKRTAEARIAFSAALAGSGKTRADAAYGLALALLRVRLTDDAEAVIALYPLTAARDREIRLEIYWQKARSAFDRQQYQQVLNALNARMDLTPEPTDMTQLRGFAHIKLGHLGEARTIFEKLSAFTDDPGVRRGLALTNHRISVE